jgi:proteasome accessory factor A
MICGIETEYGLMVQDGGPETQVEDSASLVRGSFSASAFVGWDYRRETPRSDLRGFQVQELAYDQADARYDARPWASTTREVRSDRVLINGARLYNDHGHPEYSCPESFSVREQVLADLAGERLVLQAAQEFSRRSGRWAAIYKNNTDFHGSAYGTHESHLAPRSVGAARLAEALIPVLAVRSLLTGAGKVGHESGEPCAFQMSQRADFFVEPMNIETLARRPIFNTRDEPHADPERWIRVHVISGDANRSGWCTLWKLALVRWSIALAELGEHPVWRLENPMEAARAVSRGLDSDPRLSLVGGSWTTARHILESVMGAAESRLSLPQDEQVALSGMRQALDDRLARPDAFRRRVDWAAKRWLVEEHGPAEVAGRQALDLQYSLVDPQDSLYDGLCQAGICEPFAPEDEIALRMAECGERTRGWARGIAVQRLRPSLRAVTWSRLEFAGEGQTAELAPDRRYPAELAGVESVEEFLEVLQSA